MLLEGWGALLPAGAPSSVSPASGCVRDSLTAGMCYPDPFPGHRPQGCLGKGHPHGFGAPAEGPVAGGLTAAAPFQPDPVSFAAAQPGSAPARLRLQMTQIRGQSFLPPEPLTPQTRGLRSGPSGQAGAYPPQGLPGNSRSRTFQQRRSEPHTVLLPPTLQPRGALLSEGWNLHTQREWKF